MGLTYKGSKTTCDNLALEGFEGVRDQYNSIKRVSIQQKGSDKDFLLTLGRVQMPYYHSKVKDCSLSL